ncbi:MAG: translocation/assembly module TamB domain-containing protein [Bacteroidales bacterium]|nr:translocation/assembly module TamB domain-containing protein [Bacteroidales bacterium]
MKRWVKIVLAVIAALVALVVAALVLLQIPSVQKSVCNSVLKTVSKSTGLEITAGDVHLSLIDRVILEDVGIMNGRDTVIACRKASVSISPFALLKKSIHINRVSLEGGTLYPSAFPKSEKKKDAADTSAFVLPDLNVHLERLTIDDFRIVNYVADAPHVNRSRSPRQIDFNDLLVSDLQVDIRDLNYTAQKASAKVRKIAMREQVSGAELQNLSFDAAYDTTGLRVSDFNFNDTYTNFTVPEASMKFSSFSDFDDFFNKVSLDATLQDALLDLSTLGTFLDSVATVQLKLIIDGRITGTVSDLQTDHLHVWTGTKESFVDISAHLVGLPDALNTMATVVVHDSYTYTRDIAQIVWEVVPRKESFDRKSISSLAPGTRFSFNGTLNGFFLDFVAYGAVHSNIGNGKVDIVCRDVNFSAYEILGFMDVKEFDLGHFLQVESLGKVTCHASLSSFFPAKPEDTELFVDELTIPKFEFNNYTYSNISAAGNMRNGEFEGRIVSGDPNLKFMLQGILAPANEAGNSLYHIKLSLGHADLSALNFDKRPLSSVRMNAVADLTQTSDGRLMGKISITDIQCKSPDGTFDLDDIDILTFNGDKRYMLGINSGMLQARYRGTAFVTSIIPQVEGMLMTGKLDNLAKQLKLKPETGSDSYSLRVKALDLRSLLGFLSPGTHVENGSTVTLQSEGGNEGSISVKSDLLAFNQVFVQGLDAGLDFQKKSASADIRTQMVRFGDIAISEAGLTADCAGNSAMMNLGFCNDPDSLDSGHIKAMLSFPNPKESTRKMLLNLGDSFLRLGGEQWTIDPSSVYFADKNIAINDFKLYNNDQGVEADGVLSGNPRDTCGFSLRNLDLSLVNMLMSTPLNISGALSGDGKVTGIFSTPDVFADVAVDSLFFAGQQIGHIDVSSKWDDTLRRVNLLARNIVEGRQALIVDGYFKPDKQAIYAKVNASKFNLGIIEPFVSDIVTDVSGALTADMTVSGPMSALDISCRDARIHEMGAKLVYTQVPYKMDGYVDISSSKIHLKDFTVSDMENGSGEMEGTITHDHFKDINLDINIMARNMIGFDTDINDNETFYGKAYATGKVNLAGPVNDLALRIDVEPRKGTVVNIPIGNATTSQTSILTFVDNRPKPRLSSIDSLINLHRAKEEAQDESAGGGLDVYVRVRANDDAKVNIEINSDTGDALSVRGDGTVDIAVKDNDFSIMGDYIVSEGDYTLDLMGLVTRDFSLASGSTIHFNGDIMQSELNMTASYKTKASISPLIAGGTSNSSLRRPVNCGIRITDKLANPSLSFTIDIDDLDPTTEALIDNTLNTEEKRMRQFLALIISGSFIPDEQSGIVNNTSVSYFNATEIMANQLNSIFQQLNIPLDLGFNYQPTDTGQDMFDVAVSTQLINNRVSVNGNIGNRRYMTSNRDDIVGDVDVEVKLDNRGKTRLKLFSHSADEYSNYLDQTQRNGVGISYQEEFDSLKELLRRLQFKKRKSAQPAGRAPSDTTAVVK